MAEIIRMPKLSDTMTEGVVVCWHKKVGETVKVGELLADIETDKATMEFESFSEGVLLYTGAEIGKAAPVDSVLAILGEKGEDISGIIKEEQKAKSKNGNTPASKEKESATLPTAAKPAGKTAGQSAKQPPAPDLPQPETNTPQPAYRPGEGRQKASPLAKKLARENSLNIKGIGGTGEGGRVIKRDIENFFSEDARPFSGVEKHTEVEVSQMRKTIARKLSESKNTAPHFYLNVEINMERMIEVRNAVSRVSSTKISFNDIVIKAVATALKRHPKINSSWLGDKIRYFEHIHIGVAVAVDDGLHVPVIKFADGKTLSQISAEAKKLSRKAKKKKLQPKEWEGNTFTISNLGMFGIDEFTAIINSPEACIMAVGAIKQTPVVRDGAVVPGNVMKVTLSCDHRVVDGATAAAFLQTFKFLMENPDVFIGDAAF